MKSKDILNMLNHIETLIKKEDYKKATDYIEKQKMKVLIEEDIASEYIDDLVKELK